MIKRIRQTAGMVPDMTVGQADPADGVPGLVAGTGAEAGAVEGSLSAVG